MNNIIHIINVCNFIATISVNQKPCFSKQKIIDNNSTIGTLSRKWWYQENRNTNIVYLNTLVSDINGLLINDDLNYENLKHLKHSIDSAINGLNNLINTYNDDKEISNKYISFSEKFTYFVEQLEIKIQSHHVNTGEITAGLDWHGFVYIPTLKNIYYYQDRIKEIQDLKNYISD